MSNNNCKVTNAQCENNELVKNVKALLLNFKGNPKESLLAGISPMSQSTISEIENALDKYSDECAMCAKEGRNDYKCMEQAAINFRRRVPMFANNIYPWKNYDWNYGNYITNNYSPKNTGATTEGSFDGLRRNALAIQKLVNGYIKDPIPNDNSKAAEANINSDYPDIDSCVNDPGCRTTQKVRAMLDEQKPVDSEFLNQKIDGKYSSSYFFKAGDCPQPTITTETDCKSKKYTWIPINESKGTGNCFSPRYAFIDNSSKSFFNGSKMEGILPTMASDITLMSPDNIAASLSGKSIRGSYQLEPCPSIENKKEGFTSGCGCKNQIDYKDILLFSIAVLSIGYLIKIYKK